MQSSKAKVSNTKINPIKKLKHQSISSVINLGKEIKSDVQSHSETLKMLAEV